MIQALWILGAYLLGSFPTAYVVTRMAKGVDIRTVGSGNVGATNVFRIVGKKAGLFTLAVDVLKGFLPVFLAERFYGGGLLPIGVGLAAVLGHGWSPWMDFRGGKGVATSAGIFAALLPVPTAVAIGVFLAGFLVTRRVSVGSILGAAALPVAAKLMDKDTSLVALAGLLGAFVIVKHRSNLRRIAQGDEPTVTFFKKRDSNNG